MGSYEAFTVNVFTTYQRLGQNSNANDKSVLTTSQGTLNLSKISRGKPKLTTFFSKIESFLKPLNSNFDFDGDDTFFVRPAKKQKQKKPANWGVCSGMYASLVYANWRQCHDSGDFLVSLAPEDDDDSDSSVVAVTSEGGRKPLRENPRSKKPSLKPKAAKSKEVRFLSFLPLFSLRV